METAQRNMKISSSFLATLFYLNAWNRQKPRESEDWQMLAFARIRLHSVATLDLVWPDTSCVVLKFASA